MSSLTLLGTGTCQVEFERRASSVLLKLDDTPILFDCGHGILQRLLEVGIQHNTLNHIIISHFHPDHVSDLIPFLHAGAWSKRNPRTTDLHIYGPLGMQNLFDTLRQAFGTSGFQQPFYTIVIHEITEDQFKIGSYVFDSVSLPPAGNRGVRFEWKGRRYAITGDSYFHEQEIAFLRDVDLAIIDSGHIEDEEIVQLAVRSGAKAIICSHLYREIDAPQLQALAETQGYQGTLLVGRDLMTFVL